MSDQGKTKQFWAVYISYFGPLKEPQGISEWDEFIDKCYINTLLDAVRDLGTAEQTSMRKPRLGEVKRAYWRRFKMEESKSSSSAAFGTCATCKESGFVDVASAGTTAGNATLVKISELPNDTERVWISQIPCICGKGKKINAKHERKDDGYFWEPEELQRIHKLYVWPDGEIPNNIIEHRQTAQQEPEPELQETET